MKLKKRNKRSRLRGNRTAGWAMKKHKGSGNRGGKGMAGTGKRADQRKTWVIKYQFPYFGKQGTTSKSTKKRVNNVVNLDYISEKYKPGEINFNKYKILGEGEIKGKYIIKARAASESVREKVEKAGGKIILVDDKGNEKKEAKEKVEKVDKVEVKEEKPKVKAERK